MARGTCKNDVKTLFLIFNTFSGVGLGLLMFSWGVASGVLKETKAEEIVGIVVGLLYMGVGFHGYCAAISENSKMLGSYFAVMCVRSICNVTRLVRWGKLDVAGAGPGISPEDIYACMIVETIVTMVSTLLALAVAVSSDSDDNRRPEPKAIC